METDSKQFLADRYKVLPQELQKFIVSEGMSRKVQLVAKKYRLNEDQERILLNETTLVLLVLDSVDALHLNLEDSLGLAPALAENLALDIIEYVFKSVDQYLAHTQEELLVPDAVQPQLQPQPQPVIIPEVKVPLQTTTLRAEPSVVIPPQVVAVTTPTPPTPPPPAPLPKAKTESLSKQDILYEIENPPRTVIRKYVLEHEPITDPDHLIDDTIDARTKLEDHYSN